MKNITLRPYHISSFSFCFCDIRTQPFAFPSALQLFLVTGSASILRVQQPTSFTSNLCLCHCSLDALTVPFMWGISQHLSDHLHPVMAQSHFHQHPHACLSFHFFSFLMFLMSASSQFFQVLSALLLLPRLP